MIEIDFEGRCFIVDGVRVAPEFLAAHVPQKGVIRTAELRRVGDVVHIKVLDERQEEGA